MRVKESLVVSSMDHILRQGLRFLTNILLTRLLIPEAFGMMAIVSIVLQCVNCFSDFGFHTSIIQHKDGESRHFVDTVWTYQVVRGFFLSMVTFLIAGPIGSFYNEALLSDLLRAISLVPLINGFSSMSLMICRRQLRLIGLSIIEQVSYILSVIFMLWYSYIYRDV